MAKYQFKKKGEEPSDEQIRSKMDFNNILKQQQDIHHFKLATKPLYKKTWFLGFMVLLGVICLVLIFDESSSEIENNRSQKDSVAVDSLKN